MWDVSKVFELVSIVALVNGLTIWAVKRLLDNQRDIFVAQIRTINGRDDGQDTDLQSVRDEINDFKVEATRSFIHREDAIIYFGRFEQKIDAIWKHLIDMRHFGGKDGS